MAKRCYYAVFRRKNSHNYSVRWCCIICMQCRYIYPPCLLPLLRSRILTASNELDQRVIGTAVRHGARVFVRVLKRKPDTLNTNVYNVVVVAHDSIVYKSYKTFLPNVTNVCQILSILVYLVNDYTIITKKKKKKKKISRRPRSVARELIPFEALWAGEG